LNYRYLKVDVNQSDLPTTQCCIFGRLTFFWLTLILLFLSFHTMKNILFLIVIFTGCFYSVKSQTIIGTVKSSTGATIAFANVVILNSFKNITTDKFGKFSLSISKGEWQITISAKGYITTTQSFKIDNRAVNVEIILSTDPAFLEEVVVTGTKSAVAKNYVPFIVSTVNRAQIENSSESSLLPVLAQQVPGLFVTQRGITGFGVGAGSAGSISMRGLSGTPNNKVLVLINGNPQFMGIFGHPLADAFVASDVQKVEVIHGSGSVLYGSNAMGGVINIITRNQHQEGIFVNGTVLNGSYNTQKYMLNAGYRKKGFSVMSSFNHDRTDGHRENSAFKILNGFLKLKYQFNEHLSVEAESSIAKYKASDPGMEGGTKGQSIAIFRGSTYFNLANKFKKVSGNMQLYYNYGNHSITDGFRSADINYGFSLFQTFKYIKNNTTTVGFDYKTFGGKARNVFAMNGLGIYFGNHIITEWAPYVFSQQVLFNKLIISAGLRLENNSVFGGISVPSTGVSYLATKSTTIKASFSKGFRSPTVLELYLFPPANAFLKPEKMNNYEMSIHQQFLKEKLLLECTLFNVQGSNLIQTVFVGGAPKNLNSGVFNNTGVEMSARYAINKQIDLAINYAYTHFKMPVIGSPVSQLTINSNYKRNKFSFNINSQIINGLYKLIKPVELTSNYILINAKVMYNINSFIDVFMKGENLTNQTYQINNGYGMPGIIAFGGMNFHLSKR